MYVDNLEINNNLGYLIFLEHKEVFTVGKFSKSKYLNLNTMNGIKIVNSSRGGDITYHGPDQLVFYPILSIKNLAIKPRDLVDVILDSLIKVFKNYNLESKKNLILVTHYVFISEVLNYGPSSGEMVVSDKKFNIIGSVEIDF